MNRYTFMRWLRSGAAGAVRAQEGENRAERRARFTVEVEVQGLGATAQRDLSLHGPGDVAGLAAGQIIRRFPEPGTLTASTGAFAHVELDDPDLPWRYTPFGERTTADPANAALRREGTLNPWLCVIVVERREGVSYGLRPGDTLPILTIKDGAAGELPLLDEAHGWAHVQVAGDLPAGRSGITTMIDGEPQRVLSRLVAPRLLSPDTPYLACLVPVFAAGRQAGLGEPLTAAPDEHAWAPGAVSVTLPVYDSWEFTTGPAGEFEQLVRRLRPVRLDEVVDADGHPLVGKRPMDVGSPGFGIPDDPARAASDLFGALRLDGGDPLTGVGGDLGAKLHVAINVTNAVAPPVYGRWHAAAPVGVQNPSWTSWLSTLNLNPGLRVAAAMGAEVVRARQEEFMAAAWEQVGQILKANQLLRQAELALAGTDRIYHRHLEPLTDVRTLEFAVPALSRLRSTGDPRRTLTGVVADYCLPQICLTGGWARLMRRGAPLVRRIERLQDGRRYDPAAVTNLVAGGDRQPPPPAPAPATLVTAQETVDLLNSGTNLAWPAGIQVPAAARTELASALAVLQERSEPESCEPTPLDSLAEDARQRLRPSATIPRRVRARLRLPPGLRGPDRIDPIMVAPQITAPVARFLADQGQDWLLPGLSHVPAESVSSVVANQAFVEAFLTGMNHEMSRELLWRGYPTDQRGTVFRHFFDARAAAGPPPGDITAIHGWISGELGTHPARAGPVDRFVVVLRGELLRRFPRATIVLVKAASPGGKRVPGPVDTTASLPVFSGRLDPDVMFLGFDISAEVARGDPGYYVVFQEQPTEPCFGLGAVSGKLVGGHYRSWTDLGRPDVVTVGAKTQDGVPVGYLDLAATTTAGFLAKAPQGTGTPTWDGRSDSVAAIFLRRPFRLFLHGSDILPRTGP